MTAKHEAWKERETERELAAPFDARTLATIRPEHVGATRCIRCGLANGWHKADCKPNREKS